LHSRIILSFTESFKHLYGVVLPDLHEAKGDTVLIQLLPFSVRNGQNKHHLLIPANRLAVEVLQNQWIIGRVLTRHVGLKPDLKDNNRISTGDTSKSPIIDVYIIQDRYFLQHPPFREV